MSKMPDEQDSRIIESGSNEDGSYVKYSDGTLICYNNYFSCSANSVNIHLKFPFPFKENPTIVLTNVYSVSPDVIWSLGRTDLSGFDTYPRLNNDVANVNSLGNYVAMRSLEIKKERKSEVWKL